MKPVDLPLDVLTSLPSALFSYPHVFQTAGDDKRTGNSAYRRFLAMLADADVVKIHNNNTYTILYKDGAVFTSSECIGSTPNSSYTLRAIIDSGVEVVVERE